MLIDSWFKLLRMSCECDTTVFKVQLLKKMFFPLSCLYVLVFLFFFFLTALLHVERQNVYYSKNIEHGDVRRGLAFCSAGVWPHLIQSGSSWFSQTSPLPSAPTVLIGNSSVAHTRPLVGCMLCLIGVESHDNLRNEYLGFCLDDHPCVSLQRRLLWAPWTSCSVGLNFLLRHRTETDSSIQSEETGAEQLQPCSGPLLTELSSINTLTQTNLKYWGKEDYHSFSIAASNTNFLSLLSRSSFSLRLRGVFPPDRLLVDKNRPVDVNQSETTHSNLWPRRCEGTTLTTAPPQGCSPQPTVSSPL